MLVYLEDSNPEIKEERYESLSSGEDLIFFAI